MTKLDLKDKKILFELDKNSRLSLSELGKLVKLSKEVVFHRLNRLVKENIILRFHTVTSIYRFNIMAYKIYLRLQDISKEDYNLLSNSLMNDKDIFWMGTSKGRWDLMIGVLSNNLEEFFKVHDRIIEKFSTFIQEKELSISRKNLQYNRRWLYNDKTPPITFTFGEGEEPIKTEKEDNLILKELASNSRIKITEISKKTNISTDMISYRIKKMEKKKIIRGYKCLFNSKELGFVTCKAFVFFKDIREQRRNEFIEYCKMQKNSVNIVITFAPWDLEIMFEVENFEEFYDIMDHIKTKFKDIVKFYESVLMTSEPKQLFLKE